MQGLKQNFRSGIFAPMSDSKTETLKPADPITEGPIAKGILSFFFPILFGSFFQQMYNITDAIIVGRFVGKEALGAVGGGTATFINLLVGLFVGIANGASVVISQYFGAKDRENTHRAIQTAINMSVWGGALVMAVGLLTSRWVMTLIDTPAEILDMSVTYLAVYFTGTIPMFLYNVGASTLRSMGDSKRPLYILIAGCVVNIGLDILFVAVFRWGVAGAAWATVACQVFSAVLTLILLKKTTDFSFHERGIDRNIFRMMLYLGIPAGIQGMMYSISNIIIQKAINVLGTDTVAANAAYSKVDSFFWMCINSFGVAVTVFSGQNYGAHNYGRVRKSMKVCLGMSAITAVIISAAFMLWGRTFLSIFTTDEKVLDIGVQIVYCIAPYFLTWISIEILSGTMRGCGQSLIPTLFTVFGICVLRVVWILCYFPAHHTISGIMAAYPLTWTATSLLFWGYYLFGHWMNVENGARAPRTLRLHLRWHFPRISGRDGHA